LDELAQVYWDRDMARAKGLRLQKEVDRLTMLLLYAEAAIKAEYQRAQCASLPTVGNTDA
jgi:hypothetical protein